MQNQGGATRWARCWGERCERDPRPLFSRRSQWGPRHIDYVGNVNKALHEESAGLLSLPGGQGEFMK